MNGLQLGLAVVFALAGVTCLGAIWGVSRVPNADVRKGLVGLLLLSGLWALAEVGRLLAGSPATKELMYILGLVVGLPTVGAWLYFCSAYTGHSYHRQPLVRQAAAAGYLLVVGVKITNPYHELYFRSELVSTPFVHLRVELMPAHWVVTGLAYVLTGIGFYLLYELFTESELETRALSGLVVVTALPAVLDIFSYTGDLLLTLNYEPVGVAVFAVGVLYVVDEQFIALPAFWRRDVLDALDEPILVFGRTGALRDYNPVAAEQFPAVETTVGQPLDAAYPELAAALADDADIVETDHGETTAYYAVERQGLTVEDRRFGEVVILYNVTVLERQRRELRRQNEQFDDFSEAITHELRNGLAIAQGYVDMLQGELVDDGQGSTPEYYEHATEALTRMERITADLARLAQYGQTFRDGGTCDLRTGVQQGWDAAEMGERGLSVEGDGTVEGDGERLTELFRNAFEFARAMGATDVSVSLGDDETVVRYDGESLSPAEMEAAFAYGEAVPSAEAGMLLPNVRTIARSHGWTVEADPDHDAGGTLRIRTA